MSLPPFPAGYRASGLLLPVASLPSPFGIGDFGPCAFEWIDRLRETGQTWWHSLPLSPGGIAPGQKFSSFAGNELLISPQRLFEEGLLLPDECEIPTFPARTIDYDAVIRFKRELLETTWENFSTGARPDLRPAYNQFCGSQAHWLDDYALFRSLKTKFNGLCYLDWPAELVRRAPAAIAQARHEFADAIGQVCFVQFLLFQQAESLKRYAHTRGVRLIGDLPFFVSSDSSEVWANPELFQLDEDRRSRAGVHNPMYDWDVLHQTGYRSWVDRMHTLLDCVDVVSLDHFGGFSTAQEPPGPGIDFFRTLEMELGSLPFFAGHIDAAAADVQQILEQTRIPPARTLQFESNRAAGIHSSNAVMYTGVHDSPGPELVRLTWSGPAALAMARLRDLVYLGNADNSRFTEDMLDAEAFQWLRNLTYATNRMPTMQGSLEERLVEGAS